MTSSFESVEPLLQDPTSAPEGDLAMSVVVKTLTGKVLTLEPITAAHRDEMRAALDVDPQNWEIQYMAGHGSRFEAYWEAMNLPFALNARIAFAVRLRSSGHVVGTNSFHHISPANRTLEVGSTFLRPEVRGTAVNPEMKLLMLNHAFQSGTRRVALTVDERNQRSQAAVAKLGAVREGVLRSHLVTWTGHVRDTVTYSIVAQEWPAVRADLQRRLLDFCSTVPVD